MNITFSENAVTRIAPKLHANSVIVLDFDDGVGPFSKFSVCSLDVAFNLIIVDKQQLPADFDTQIESNFSSVYIKGYSKNQLDLQLTVDCDKYLRYALAGQSGVIDSTMGLRDLTDQDLTQAAEVGNATGC
ncbi:MAG: iron-sulfur cluster biosynthesis family protein [Lactobacillaceae bacterium]|jgi:uncharacterized protein YqkB|nr:iron-sulfur cluster biosynthesis family protein [Lactobacillaceae bacterium]